MPLSARLAMRRIVARAAPLGNCGANRAASALARGPLAAGRGLRGRRLELAFGATCAGVSLAAAVPRPLRMAAHCKEEQDAHHLSRDVAKQVEKLKTELFMKLRQECGGEWVLTEEQLTWIFDKVDANHDGNITYEEFHAYLVAAGISDHARAEVLEYFNRIDIDHSGGISNDEWVTHFQRPEYVARYAAMVLHAFASNGRLLAFTSELGESVRPTMPKWFVNGCYGLTGAYIFADIGYQTSWAYMQGVHGQEVLRICIQACTFQLIASVLVPGLIVSRVVHLGMSLCKRLPPGRLAAWTPTLMGLVSIPVCPLVDEPIEEGVDRVFHNFWPEGAGVTSNQVAPFGGH